MLNNDFYNDPETLDFIAKTKKELVEFKNNTINLNTVIESATGNKTSVANDSSDNEETVTSGDDMSQNDKVQKVKEFFDKKIEYNKKVEKATKKAYSENYRKPPKQYQFKKGKSGNVHGRPPRRPVITARDAIYKVFYKQIETSQNGKTVKMPLLEVFAESVVRDAIKKDGASRKFLLQNPRFINHNFMEPSIKEAIDSIKDKPDVKLDEKMEQLLYEAIAKLLEDEELK